MYFFTLIYMNWRGIYIFYLFKHLKSFASLWPKLLAFSDSTARFGFIRVQSVGSVLIYYEYLSQFFILCESLLFQPQKIIII